jgi:hypothetical protein
MFLQNLGELFYSILFNERAMDDLQHSPTARAATTS